MSGRAVTAAALLLSGLLAGGAAGSGDDETRCLALTIYWEARDETREGRVAVGWVVLNRQHSTKFPSTICHVVKQRGEEGCQFSFWCDGKPDEPTDGVSWARARELASELLTNPPPDPTHGATMYHRADLHPAWSRQHRETARIGHHIFYR